MNFALISKIFRQNLIQPEKIAKKKSRDAEFAATPAKLIPGL